MTRIADVRVTEALRRAAALEADDWEAAIEVLGEANRLGRSAELEIELVALRHRAAARVVGTDDPEPALAGGTAPAVGASGLPETTVDARSPPPTCAPPSSGTGVSSCAGPSRGRRRTSSPTRSIAAGR